ncbi:hypothetical protein JYQ79_03010 [Anaerobutyricum hallii]|uniref:hypothetical protein n=1 Tax=Anaerobutyricum hallii TaxID=39488 RepID=UPI001ADD95D0|nr:hypothetical protein [Anaerobutyricum hallii]MBP0065757.1 hypothetical protein [Anaerobutyricum hallii]
MNREIWTKKIRYIKNLKDEELIRMESYSLIVSFMLSKDAFKFNVDLKQFMEKLGIECKPYLLKSRTAILGRTIRVLEKAEKQQLLKYVSVISEEIDSLPETQKSETVNKKNEKNYMKEVLKLYGRKGNQ